MTLNMHMKYAIESASKTVVAFLVGLALMPLAPFIAAWCVWDYGDCVNYNIVKSIGFSALAFVVGIFIAPMTPFWLVSCFWEDVEL